MSETAPQPDDSEAPIDWEALAELPPIPVPEDMPQSLPWLDVSNTDKK